MSTAVNPLGQTTNNGSQIISVNAAQAATTPITLSLAQSGSIISLTSGYAAALTINLPAPATAAGFTCKFVVNTTLAAFAVIITSPTANTMCLSSINNATPAVGAIGASTGFGASTAKGASIDISCDGTNYYAVGRTLSAAGSITNA